MLVLLTNSSVPEAPGLNSLCKLSVLSLHVPLVPLISLVMSSQAIVLNTTLRPGSQGVLRGEQCCICVYFSKMVIAPLAVAATVFSVAVLP